MARPLLASPGDLQAALGADVVMPDAQAVSLLERASAIVRAFAGRTWLDEDGALLDVPDDVPGVVVSMVERATRNVEGLTSEQTGPFGRSWSSEAAQRLYLTSLDKLVIRASSGGNGLGVITTTRGPLETASLADDWDLPEAVIW